MVHLQLLLESSLPGQTRLPQGSAAQMMATPQTAPASSSGARCVPGQLRMHTNGARALARAAEHCSTKVRRTGLTASRVLASPSASLQRGTDWLRRPCPVHRRAFA
eukprot:7391998-Prymnesium_polylepis.3